MKPLRQIITNLFCSLILFNIIWFFVNHWDGNYCWIPLINVCILWFAAFLFINQDFKD